MEESLDCMDNENMEMVQNKSALSGRPYDCVQMIAQELSLVVGADGHRLVAKMIDMMGKTAHSLNREAVEELIGLVLREIDEPSKRVSFLKKMAALSLFRAAGNESELPLDS